MNAWSHRRKRNIFLIVLSFFIVIIGVPLFFYLHKTPTCTDGKRNGDEQGIDCGGSCKLLCSAETLPLLSKGDARVLKVGTSTYEVVLEVENPNVSASVYKGGYTIKLYEANDTIPMKIIDSEAYIPHGSSFVIFEGPFDTGERVPVRASFEWKTKSLLWTKDTSVYPDLTTNTITLENPGSTPRLTATLKNNSLTGASHIELMALVLDQSGNTIAASKTFVEELGGGESVPVAFSWPNPFDTSTTTVRILPRVLPDRSFIH